MIDHISGPSVSRSSRAMDRYMVLICALFVFALCTNFTAAAQNPNLLEQMEGDFSELSNKAGSWSMYPATDTDTIAQDAYDVGLWSESACWELEPEDGLIEITGYDLPTEIALCVTDRWLSQFYVDVHVVGGYYIVDGQQYLILEQNKGETYCIDIYVISERHTDCGEDYYRFGFKLKEGVDQIVFEANNFPTTSIVDPFRIDYDAPTGDLQKEIYAYYCSLWTGCDLPDQQFLISLVQSKMGDLSYVSPFPLHIR